MDRGFFITLQAVRRQLAAMPSDLYLLRLIHHQTRRLFSAEPLWTGFQLCCGGMIRFLRVRNREGFDVYIRPYAGNRNAGYILVDLDLAAPSTVAAMRAEGHEPCVVVQTSTGRLQAWVHVSPAPLEARLATAIGKDLAHSYGADTGQQQNPDERAHSANYCRATRAGSASGAATAETRRISRSALTGLQISSHLECVHDQLQSRRG